MQTTDLGYGRGWLAPDAAASVHRIDQQLGRPADINDAGRSAEQADANYAAWIRYQNGGPWAPYALPASESVHCRGEAADSDDWYDPDAAAVWRDNGWRQTARYDDDRDEPWHGERFPDLDNHRNDPAPAPADATPSIPEPDEEEDEDMAMKGAYYKNAAGTTMYMLFNEVSGFISEHQDVDGSYNTAIAQNWDTKSFSSITEGHAKNIKTGLAEVRTGKTK